MSITEIYPMKITVKRIETAVELEKAHLIRRKVFIKEQGISIREEMDEYEDTSIQVLALVDSQFAGTARWRETEEGLKLERFAVLKPYRGRGVGRALVDYCLDENIETDNIFLYAQETVIEFYRKFGFRPVSDKFLEAGIVHQKMQLYR